MTNIIKLLLSFCFAYFFFSSGSGFAMVSSSPGYTLHAESSIQAIIVWLMLVFTLVFLFKRKIRLISDTKPMGIFVRFFSLAFDMVCATILITFPISMTVLLVEYIFTGSWTWEIYRHRDEPWDYIAKYLSFFSMVAPIIYFSIFVYFQKQSFGNFMINGIILKKENQNYFSCLLRTLLGFLAVSLWPISLYYAIKSKEKLFFHDEVFDTKPLSFSNQVPSAPSMEQTKQ